MTAADLDSLRQPPLKFTREEILAILDRGTKTRLDMPAQSFIHLLRAGRIEDLGAVADLVVLVDLLRDDDPVFNAA